MKFKHFTMEELSKMTQDQQRGYVLAELVYGLGMALTQDMKANDIPETATDHLKLRSFMVITFTQMKKLLDNAMTEDTEEFEKLLQDAVGAPKALNYE